jgi:Holliday junction DNA helicase RuvA
MISRIEGPLESISENTAVVRLPLVAGATGGEAGAVCYQIMLPAFAVARLQGDIGSIITLHTLQFFESQNQGAIMLPRLAGFLTSEDRRFYELFCTCKGIGHRRALRALALSVEQIAAAIVDRDLAVLQSLPEIGRRTAETIVTTLRDKVQPFVSGSYEPPTTARRPRAAVDTDLPATPQVAIAREALEVLLQLGENRTDAVRWIDQALVAAEDTDRPDDTQALLTRIYQIRSGA